MRRLLAATAAVSALIPAASHAQDKVTLWDVLSLDRIAQSVLHSGIQMLRTQMDLQYGDLAVDLRRSRVTMTDVTAWPFFDWDEYGECEISIGALTLVGTPIDISDRFNGTARISGLTATKACFPTEAHMGFEMAGLDTLTIPRMTIDMNYGMPSSDALVRVFADVDGVATFDLSGDFSYFWFDGREDMEEPTPVMFLSNATLAVENKGLWETLSSVLPPPLTGENSGEALRDMIVGGLTGGAPEAPSAEMTAFADSIVEVWPQFVANPQRLVLETGFDGDVYVDIEALDDDPDEIFVLLQPQLALAPARVSSAVPVELLSRATGDDAADLTDAEKATVGEALVTGVGAPRNVTAGVDLLEPLAEAGDAGVALLLAQALEVRDPDAAYEWALRAGAGGEPGATAMLDKLENTLDFATVLSLQEDVSGAESGPADATGSLAALREQAAMRLSGSGAARSYGLASMYAMLASAAGDPEAADMLAEIDELVRLGGGSAMTAWSETEARYSDRAMQLWVDQDLPSQFAQ
ncbi:hypothetical protein [Psychromarinibacter halotolerans]|uniref:Sel1 repeat family protein n=1 Tax=Psychromarinibacter halotolerans TaxID=1775175 RepID=A0ABV7GWY2_9RHOB|nr:hypothetical protein [Psychromarinibacter halotolerans]MDF0594721.1 hypothetical protein [Psychromarinibacter halotolerans]